MRRSTATGRWRAAWWSSGAARDLPDPVEWGRLGGGRGRRPTGWRSGGGGRRQGGGVLQAAAMGARSRLDRARGRDEGECGESGEWVVGDLGVRVSGRGGYGCGRLGLGSAQLGQGPGGFLFLFFVLFSVFFLFIFFSVFIYL